MAVSSSQRFTLALTLVTVVAVLLGGSVSPGSAAAAPSAPTPGDEGEPPLLRDVLEATGRRYVEAKNAVAKSQARQRALARELRKAEQRINALGPAVGEVAANAYRIGRLGPVLVLLDSSSPDNFLERAKGLNMMAMRDNSKLRELNAAVDQAAKAKAAIDAEVVETQKHLKVMKKQKQEAERALRLVGRATGGFVSATSPRARPAPRNRDGSWPRQSCSENDPTTSGCITPRTLHALKEARRVGFSRHASCYRSGGPYEHPRGRACDFSSQRSGFGGDAHGGDRLYGNNLTAFLVRNADRLGVLYVIWYRQFWSPATGWKSYSGAYGDPSSDHTNHVHLSML